VGVTVLGVFDERTRKFVIIILRSTFLVASLCGWYYLNDIAIRLKFFSSYYYCFIVSPCNMINIFIITNTMHTIGVDKITLFKTT